MAVEVLPSGLGIVSTPNFLFAAPDVTISGTLAGEQALYPATNLLSTLRSRRYRSNPSMSGSAVEIDFDLGPTQGAKLPTMLGLVDCNLTSPGHVFLTGANDLVGTGAQTWSLSIYAQASNGTLRWYLGNPDSGTANAHRYWAVHIDFADGYNTSYVEIGCIWLGTYSTIGMVNPNVKLVDPTKTAVSASGGRYSAQQQVRHAVTYDSRFLPISTVLALKDTIDSVRGVDPVWLDIYASTTDTTHKAHGAFYGYFNDKQPFTFSHPQWSQYGDIKIDFVEAMG